MNTPPLAEHIQKNFETMLRAVVNGDLALLSCLDAKTKQPVAAVCAISHDAKTGEYVMVPFAKMFDGDPYEELIPPHEDQDK